MSTKALYTPTILHTSHSSRNRFTHDKGGITHVLNVESTRQPYGPHPHTNQHIKVSTLCTTHSSNFWKKNFMIFFFLMLSCVQTNIHKSLTIQSKTTVTCHLTREQCIESLQSNKMSTKAIYTPTILHTLHTRPGIDSHMSREGSLTI
jgi:hypothetical protein